RPFGQHYTVVGLEHRDLALWIDLVEIPSILGLLLAQVDLHEIGILSGLPEHDVGRERARARRKIQFHRTNSLVSHTYSAGADKAPRPAQVHIGEFHRPFTG